MAKAAKNMPEPKPKRTMSDSHKQAIASGRSEGAIVKRYLEAIQVKGKPGRPLDPERLRGKLEAIDAELASSDDPLRKLQLEQDKLDTQRKLESLAPDEKIDITELEAAFIKVAASYAERKGLSYTAFRNVGVPAGVLREAKVPK